VRSPLEEQLAWRVVDMSVSAAATILAACVSAAAVVFAAWLANSLQRQLKRQLKQGVQEQQLKAYEGLWAATENAAAVREKGDWAGGPLSEKERGELFHEITKWYYGKAGGIYLAPKTRCIYLRVKENLVCPETDIEPKGALDELSREFPDVHNNDERRSLLGLRQPVAHGLRYLTL